MMIKEIVVLRIQRYSISDGDNRCTGGWQGNSAAVNLGHSFSYNRTIIRTVTIERQIAGLIGCILISDIANLPFDASIKYNAIIIGKDAI